MEWVRDLHLWNIDFKVDSKTVMDNIYGKHTGVSEFSDIISYCAHLFCTDLTNSHVKFIMRQANEVVHSLVKATPLEASFRIYSNIPTYIESIIINEMYSSCSSNIYIYIYIYIHFMKVSFSKLFYEHLLKETS